MKKVLIIFASIIIINGCKSGEIKIEKVDKVVEINEKSIIDKKVEIKEREDIIAEEVVMRVGELFFFKEEKYLDTNVIYSTKDKDIATIDNKGKISGISKGKIYVTAKGDKKNIRRLVIVEDALVVTNFTISIDKVVIIADNEDKTNISVRLLDQFGNPMEKRGVEYYVGDKKLEGNYFKTSKEGFYDIKAKYNGISSKNSISVRAVEGEKNPEDIFEFKGVYLRRKVEELLNKKEGNIYYRDIYEINSMKFEKIDEFFVNDLKKFKNLKSVNLSGLKLANISELSKIKSLEEINLQKVKSFNLRGLPNLPRLRKLDISNSNIFSLDSLEEIKGLEEFYADYTKIKTLNLLKEYKKLKKLTLVGIKFDDFESLKEFSKINFLDMSSTNISDLSYLSNMKEMKKLHLSHNNITDIDGIKNLIKIKELDLSVNKIDDISILENMRDLEYLILDYTDINSLESLKKLMSLKQVDLYGTKKLNKTKKSKDYKIIKKLIERGVEVYY